MHAETASRLRNVLSILFKNRVDMFAPYAIT